MADENTGVTKGDIESLMQGFMAKHDGDYKRAAATLYDDNHRLREDKRKLVADNDELKGKVPKEGSLVLSPEDTKKWASYVELGEDPGELKKRLEKATKADLELAGVRKTETLREAAEAEGFKVSVLQRLVADGEEVIVETAADGKKSAFVKKGDAKTPLGDYAKTAWAEFLPSLTSEGGAAATPNGTQFVRSGQGGTQTQNDEVEDFINKRNKERASAGNALVPAATRTQ